LSGRQAAKIYMLAILRSESFQDAYRHTVSNLLDQVPARIIERNILSKIDFKSVGMENGFTKITLSNGRVFHGHPSRVKHISLFYTFRDLVPKGFTPETYAAGVDAVSRYVHGGEYRFFPGPGGVVIEGGAYVGYKAVRMAEIVGAGGAPGKVIAIEIGRRNFDLMRKNVEANGLSHVITPMHCGIWRETGEMAADFEYANAYHLAAPDEHGFCTRKEMVPTRTLDDIIDENRLGIVDFLNLQLNGSEYEGLLGLRRRFDNVKIIRVAAYYTRDGASQSKAILRLLHERGCKILGIGTQGNVVAATPRFADEFQARRNFDKAIEEALA
jgi:FkbM family methyltransferase